MNWLILIVAGLFEVIWAVALKMSNGFKNITVAVVQTSLHAANLPKILIEVRREFCVYYVPNYRNKRML